MKRIIRFEVNLKELWNRINVVRIIREFLSGKHNVIRQQWFDNVLLLTGNNPCNILQNVVVKFGVFGYKIEHISGLVIAHKPYQIPFIHKTPPKFTLHIKNILILLFKLNGVEVDFDSGVVFRVVNTETICGKPIGFVIDYHRSKMAFIFENDELTKNFMFGIRVCQGVMKICEKYLSKIFN